MEIFADIAPAHQNHKTDSEFFGVWLSFLDDVVRAHGSMGEC